MSPKKEENSVRFVILMLLTLSEVAMVSWAYGHIAERNYSDIRLSEQKEHYEAVINMLTNRVNWNYHCPEGSNDYWGRCDYAKLFMNLSGVYCLDGEPRQLCRNEYEIKND
jgi:hypothetical protein